MIRFIVELQTLIKAVNIFLLVFYSFGTFCLPMGDFATLQDLPEMYRHCKAAEDKDMTLIDFITDHLVNIDGIFDKHNNGDEQKPHSPIQNQHTSSLIVILQLPSVFNFKKVNNFVVKQSNFYHSDNFIKSEYISKIFRPPIV
ncbi:MAG: hypothetical protein ORN56_01865 [Chitinophagales bacterium]|nr:hypothetical protein [Chitinophagales bacterium]